MKDKIKDTFLEMLKTTPIEKIKVKDLAQKCNISRQTFYYYYYDIFSILQYMFEKETEKALEDVTFIDDLENSYIRIMNWFKKNQMLIQVTYNYDNGRLLKSCLKKIFIPAIDKLLQKNSYGYSVTDEQLKFIGNFYFITLVSFLFDWIEKGMVTPTKTFLHNVHLIVNTDFEDVLRKFELDNDDN